MQVEESKEESTLPTETQESEEIVQEQQIEAIKVPPV